MNGVGLIIHDKIMPSEITNISQPFVVGFEPIELVATMHSLTHYVRHLSKFRDKADESFADIAKALIIRLQDVFDEDQIREQSSQGSAQERSRQS